MRLLSIETSCDETAVAILEAAGGLNGSTFNVRGNALYSQAELHAVYGGVYPSLAKREHGANLAPLLERALKESGSFVETNAPSIEGSTETFLKQLLAREDKLFDRLLSLLARIERPPIDAIAVTHGPGLEPALWVGVNFARALAAAWKLPIIPVNHLEGHIVASAVEPVKGAEGQYTLNEQRFPALCLIVSGGHTEFVYARGWGAYEVVGSTRDDSIGEAFDKVARMLGVPYPGGVGLSRLAEKGRVARRMRGMGLPPVTKRLPRPMQHTNDLDFSFSGIKTAVLYEIRELGDLTDALKADIAAEFEDAVTEVVLSKAERALSMYPASTFILGGGVSANTYLRDRLTFLCTNSETPVPLRLPATGLATDNAVMIGMTGYLLSLRGEQPLTWESELRANGALSFARANSTTV